MLGPHIRNYAYETLPQPTEVSHTSIAIPVGFSETRSTFATDAWEIPGDNVVGNLILAHDHKEEAESGF